MAADAPSTARRNPFMSDDIEPGYPISPRDALYDLRTKHKWESMTDSERADANRIFEELDRHFSNTTLPFVIRIRTGGDRGRLLSSYVYTLLWYEEWDLKWGETESENILANLGWDDATSVTPLIVSLPSRTP